MAKITVYALGLKTRKKNAPTNVTVFNILEKDGISSLQFTEYPGLNVMLPNVNPADFGIVPGSKLTIHPAKDAPLPDTYILDTLQDAPDIAEVIVVPSTQRRAPVPNSPMSGIILSNELV